jgi:hypothetical protein
VPAALRGADPAHAGGSMRNLVRSTGFGALSTGFSPAGVDIHTEDRRTAGPRLARSCLSPHSPLCPEAKSRRLIPERRIIGTAQGQSVYRRGRLHNGAFATPIYRVYIQEICTPWAENFALLGAQTLKPDCFPAYIKAE